MAKLKKKTKENGFTLVELIVVVLIMAIIAVALAPQVMKWVEKSRKSADSTDYDALFESVQVSMSNPAVYAKMSNSSEDLVLEMSSTGTIVKQGPFSSGDEFHTVMEELNPGWENVRVRSEETNVYTITVKAGVCSLVKTNPPMLEEVEGGGNVLAPVISPVGSDEEGKGDIPQLPAHCKHCENDNCHCGDDCKCSNGNDKENCGCKPPEKDPDTPNPTPHCKHCNSADCHCGDNCKCSNGKDKFNCGCK